MGVPITRTIFTPPTPERGVWGRSWRISFSTPSETALINVAIKAREEQINLFFRAVATKRSEVNLKGGLEGLSIWSRTLPRNAQKKSDNLSIIAVRQSGKRESVHLLSTLYIKQLPLPSTILPIRGTLGLFQGVVFESDFCHTNFRTTVAYDKFTNNF